MLIILTNKLDPHADYLIEQIGDDLPVFRINTDDFLNDYSYRLDIGTDGVLEGEIADQFGHRYRFGQPAVGWYRRPFFDHIDVSAVPDYVEFALSEVKSFIDAVCNLPTIHWINRPSAESAAKSKPAQLLLAARLGLRIPSTIITNRPRSAKAFIEKAEANVITKSIYSASMKHGDFEYTCVTQRVLLSVSSDDLDSVALCPTQFQSEVQKECDIRVTVIGHHVFACRIGSQTNEKTEVDWRMAAELCEHSIIEMPEQIENACRDLVSLSGLDYGAIDLVLDKHGQYWFLENNPSGQYLWIEQETELPITAAMIEHMRNKVSSKNDPSKRPLDLDKVH